MNMIEKVARALALSHGAQIVGPSQSRSTREIGWKGDGEHLDIYVERHWREHVHAAQFAIEAMRDPTEAMHEKLYSISDGPSVEPIEWWRMMIDVAISDGQSAKE